MDNFHKKLLKGLFLVLWLLAIARPSISLFFQEDSKIVLANLAEEDHNEHEHSKKEKESEFYYTDHTFITVNISELNYSIPFVYYAKSICSRTQDIQVPPPKKIV